MSEPYIPLFERMQMQEYAAFIGGFFSQAKAARWRLKFRAEMMAERTPEVTR